MKATSRTRTAVFATLIAASLSGCALESGDDAVQAANDREKSKADWKLTVEKTGGKWSGQEGNKTISGTIELRIPSADGETTIRGKFASHAVTWG